MTTETQIFNAVWSVIRRRVLERGVAATELCELVIRRTGTLRRAEGRLRAGDHPLDQESTLLPLLSRATSLGLSLYHGNRRIASVAAVGLGKPGELGGYADAELVETVLRRREIYKGALKRAGATYLVTARPLYLTGGPEDTAPIGMIEAFQGEQAFYESLVASARIGVEQRTAAQEEAADGMEGVIHFLDDVARRLQLLALNGNIIAAQAGEHGRAFRVVCRELGTLADRAKGTVTDMRKLMQTMGLDANEAHGEDTTRARALTAPSSEGDPPIAV